MGYMIVAIVSFLAGAACAVAAMITVQEHKDKPKPVKMAFPDPVPQTERPQSEPAPESIRKLLRTWPGAER